ncbi:MAG: 5'-nucleotidase C-terminal domain-containing protein [Candidatus Devosia euplotis]|nr:5'-nucleotidase C-terminal domain-containing protein [Candidatus Devosia euplotis]
MFSHAGVVADRAILPLLPDGTLIVGDHDHLLLTHEEGRSRYLHTGSWSNVYTVAEIAADGAIIIGQSEIGRFVAATMATGAEADVGFIGHTTLGTGLPQGDVSQYGFNAIVRFDDKLILAEVSAQVLAEILARANQDGAQTLEQRTGNFLYAAPTDLPTKDHYTIAANDWPTTNQKSYFGRKDLVFTPGPEVMLKALVIQALN